MDRKLSADERQVASEQFPFFCLSCGFFPWFVFFDANRKTAYPSEAQQVIGEEAKEYSTSITEDWSKLTMSSFCGRKYGQTRAEDLVATKGVGKRTYVR